MGRRDDGRKMPDAMEGIEVAHPLASWLLAKVTFFFFCSTKREAERHAFGAVSLRTHFDVVLAGPMYPLVCPLICPLLYPWLVWRFIRWLVRWRTCVLVCLLVDKYAGLLCWLGME